MGVSKPKLNCKYIREVATDKQEQAGPMVDNDDEQDSFTKILTLYPDYNKLFIQTQTILMSGDGSLPINYRHFIAVLASRTTYCPSLTLMAINSYLSEGGDKLWIKDYKTVPPKLKRLTPLMNKLWKEPWTVSKKHVKNLTVGADSWNLAQLVQAVVIICQYQSLASFLIGTGQIEARKDPDEREAKTSGDVELIDRVSVDEKEDANLTDFSWDEQGFSLMTSLYSDIAHLLDDKLRYVVKSMSPNDNLVKTAPAGDICSYVDNLFGIHQDDLSLDTTQSSIDAQNFVFHCTFPASQVDAKLDQLAKKIGYSLKVYLSIIVMELKFKNQLLYFLKAVMKHLS